MVQMPDGYFVTDENGDEYEVDKITDHGYRVKLNAGVFRFISFSNASMPYRK